MKITCIALSSANSSYNNASARCGYLPWNFAAIISDLIDAGHTVSWLERPLCQSSIDRTISVVADINPDVLLFASDGYPSLPMMAGVAVRCQELPGADYICEGVLRPASQWCDILSTADLSVQTLTREILQYRAVRENCTARNDACIDASVSPVKT